VTRTGKEDRWMLPDGIQELLPEQAGAVEQMRRELLDLFHTWGYDMVVPPLLEFTESLLLDHSADLDIQSFKVTDQLSGRTLGLRADITAQVSRIDAHSLPREGISRLCYVGSVLHTTPSAPLVSRTPIQAGAELFGESSLAADVESIELMLNAVTALGVIEPTLDLGNVAIYRELVRMADLSVDVERDVFKALQKKSSTALVRAVSDIEDQAVKDAFIALLEMHGDMGVLDCARVKLANISTAINDEIDKLVQVVDQLTQKQIDANLYIDLAELKGYRYHTGLVFSVYANGVGAPVANGGRYDTLAAEFGRERAATGFNLDLRALLPIYNYKPKTAGIWVQHATTPAYVEALAKLRQRGERVVISYSDGNYDPSLGCNRRLVLKGEGYEIEPMEEF